MAPKTDRTPHREPLALVPFRGFAGREARFRGSKMSRLAHGFHGFGSGERSGKPDSEDYLHKPLLLAVVKVKINRVDATLIDRDGTVLAVEASTSFYDNSGVGLLVTDYGDSWV